MIEPLSDFILETQVKNPNLVDLLLDYEEKAKDNPTLRMNVDRKCPTCLGPIKRSQDTVIETSMNWDVPRGIEAADSLNAELMEQTSSYMAAYSEFLNMMTWEFRQFETNLIQRYQPGMGYPAPHFEKTDILRLFDLRELVWMIYLNDVPDGGTEFVFQKRTISAERGKFLMWPAAWTHVHRGVVSKTHEKVIATGWLHRSKPI